MSSKKNLPKTVGRLSSNGNKLPKVVSNNLAHVYSDELQIEYSGRPGPYRLNPESSEEREKRLAKRKALTLKAFRKAYENHHARKVS